MSINHSRIRRGGKVWDNVDRVRLCKTEKVADNYIKMNPENAVKINVAELVRKEMGNETIL